MLESQKLHSSKVRDLFLKVLCTFLTLVLLFILCEIGFRWFGPSWLMQRMRFVKPEIVNFGTDFNWPVVYKDGQFVKFLPNSNLRMPYYEYDEIAHINEYSSRVSEFCPSGNPEGAIPILGDSMTFGIGVKDFETFTSLLGKQWNTCLLNLGIPGGSLADYLSIIKNRHIELGQPKLYIINFFVGNDLVLGDQIGRQDETRQKISKQVTLLQKWTSSNNLIFKKSYLLQYVRTKMIGLYNNFRVRFGKFRHVEPFFLATEKNSNYIIEAGKIVDEQLKELEHLSHELGFRFIFVLIPDKYQISAEHLKHKAAYYGYATDDLDIEMPNKIMHEKLTRLNIPFVDTLSCMRESKEKLYFEYDNHFTVAGNRAQAVCVAPELEKLISEARRAT